MAKLQRQVGSTSQIVTVFASDTTSTTGAGKTALTNASVTCYYKRNTGSASVASTVNTITTLGTFAGSATNAAFKEIDATNMKGLYELHIPNNALASGADEVVLMLTGSGFVIQPIEIELTATSNQDGVRMGLTALPNVASGSAGSLLTSGTGASQLNVSGGKAPATLASTDVTGNLAADLQTIKTQTVTCAAGVTILPNVGTAAHALVVDASGFVTVATNNDKTGYSLSVTPPTSAQIATAVWTDLLASSDFSTASSIGALLKTDIDAAVSSRMATFTLPTNFAALGISAGGHISNVDTLTTYTGNTPQTGDNFARLGAPAGASVSADIAAVKAAVGSPLQAGNVTVGGYAAGQDPATSVLAGTIETGVSLKQALQRIGATTAGKLSGSQTNTEVFVGLDGVTARVTVTADSSGNRTAIVYA